MQPIPFAGWSQCYRLANEVIELIVVADIGPRIIHASAPGRANLFALFPESAGLSGGEVWRNYGGHRLWHAPEQRPRTYQPDNDPVQVSAIAGGVRLTAGVEGVTGIQKEMEITLSGQGATIGHRLWNRGVWPVTLAPWALSVMAAGGVGIVPLPPRGSHQDQLLPTAALALWAYTDLADARWVWGRQHILLRQEAGAQGPQKIGVRTFEGWAAYARGEDLFLKTFSPQPDAAYPDLGVTTEMFTNHRMLELETYGPVQTLAPGACVEHVEHWQVWAGISQPRSEAEVMERVWPVVRNQGLSSHPTP